MCRLKIGLYGGSFDPIHNGHSQLAKNIFETLSLDKLYWIPSYQSLDDKELTASPQHRFHMCEIIASKHPGFIVSDYEINRGKAVYTIETIQHFHQLYPDATLFWIIGADQAVRLNTWQKPETILKLAKIAVYPRMHTNMPDHLEIADKPYPITTNSQAFAQSRIVYLKDQPYFNSASSDFKQQDNQSAWLNHHLDKQVLTYIHTYHLYNE
jgi:nicotinate-nucleotide adenylyltransferase